MQKQLHAVLILGLGLMTLQMANAQPIVRVASLSAPQSSQVLVPVQLFDIRNMELVQMGLTWDDAQIRLDSVAYSPDYPMYEGNFSYPNSRELAFNWEIDYMENPQEGDTLFSMYFTILGTCGSANIGLSESTYPLRIQRGGQDIEELVFVPGRVDIGGYLRISNDTTICSGDPFQLFIDAPLATSLKWSATEGTLSCTDCPNPEVTDLYGEASFSVEIMGPDDCVSSAFVYVNVQSYLDFGLLLFSNSPICLGDTLQFDANVIAGQSYSWTGPNGFSSTAARPILPTSSMEQSGTYDLSLVDAYGCEAGASFEVAVYDTLGNVVLDYVDGGCGGELSTLSIGAIQGGTPPYAYAIDNDAFLPIPDGPFGVPGNGNFTLYIQDANGCTRDYYFPSSPTLTVSIKEEQSPPCEGPDFDGALSVQVSGGEVPYAYTWSTAETTAVIKDLAPGEYGVTVTDSRGCSQEAIYTLEPSPIDSLVLNAVFIQPGQNVQMEVFGKNFIAVEWEPAGLFNDPTIPNPILTPLESTLISVKVTDQSGCMGVDTILVEVVQPNFNWKIVDTLSVGEMGLWCDPTQNPLGLQISINDCPAFAGNVFEYAINPSANCLEYTALSPGSDTLCFTTCLNGTTFCGQGLLILSVPDPAEDPVWPGDTNDDGLANQYDVLNFGFALDSIRGPRRPSPSLTWQAQPAFPWPQQTPEDHNYKHIDSDGNGQINLSDTLALHLNWGQTHENFLPHDTPIDERGGAPFFINADTLQAGQTYALPLVLGTPSSPAEEVYGLAFSLSYDPDVIVPGSIRLGFADSWLGTVGEDLLVMQRAFPVAGRLDVGLTRLNGQNVSGSGAIAQLYITIEDDILLHQGYPWEKSNTDLFFQIEGVKMISKDMSLIPVEVVEVEVEVISNTDEVDLSPFIKLFPNPVMDKLFIQSSLSTASQLEIVDLKGRLFLSTELAPGSRALDLDLLPSGLYLVRIWSREGVMVQKVMIGR
ncbi:MAG: T9SS type A sorting domain-containing protein [Saprospiraceae bacterium]